MRAIVCGGRDFGDRALVFNTLDHLHFAEPFNLIYEGGAKGADRLAREWATERNVPFQTIEADWFPNGGGRIDYSAGPKRNTKMLDLLRLYSGPIVVIAFPGERGTKDMVAKAEKAGVKVIKTFDLRGLE